MVRFPKAYTMQIDEQVKAMAIKDISTCGADEFVVDDVSKYTKLSDIWKSVN